MAAVKHTDIIQAKKTAFKYIVAISIFPVDPPGKIDEQFLKDSFKKNNIATAKAFLLNAVNFHSCPGLHRRIYIAEIPFVSGQLSIGFHVPFPHNEFKLVLCKHHIYHGQGNAVESEVPGGIPGIFPFVWHGNHILVFQVFPVVVTAI